MALNTDELVDYITTGLGSDLSDAAKQKIQLSIQQIGKELDEARTSRSTSAMLSRNTNGNTAAKNTSTQDSEIFTTLSDLLNGDHSDFAGVGTLLDNLYSKNKKYFSIIKDYEIMPILIPQINRVLMFLVNECLSPDIQHDSTFQIKYLGTNTESRIQSDIDKIKTEMKLDNLLRDVYMNRYKLGFEYYVVVDYNETFNHMEEMLKRKSMNEAYSGMSDYDYFDKIFSTLRGTINECSATLTVQQLSEVEDNLSSTGKYTKIDETSIKLDFKNLNIVVEKSPAVRWIEEAHAELISEAYSNLSSKNIFEQLSGNGNLNEAVTDTSKLSMLVDHLKRKKLQRCTIERFEPARMFKLKVGGRVIGYFYVTDIYDQATANVANFTQTLKDQLYKSRVNNINASMTSAEDIISKELSEKIINLFDPNVGISRLEDIDLLHNYIRNNEIFKGNKRITFYYADEIYDLSRADGSILTNAVFFTKLYSTLMLNNIMTKVLRGRGRQIHTVHLGASPNVQRYIQNAMAALTQPENNLGTMHGSFEQLMNPFNSASDIIIPTEEDNQKYIETDYIPGQDIDMDDNFLKTLLNGIVTSFGLDSAVIDATNGNLQFARTLSMESLQIGNTVRNEQQDLHDNWENLCLQVLRICGNDETRTAVDQGQVKVYFYEPKSLITQTMIDDLNNAKNEAEALADVIPEFNEDGAETRRAKFVYNMVKDRTNIDWSLIEKTLDEIKVTNISDELEAMIRKIIQEYKDNTQVKQFGDENGDGLATEEDQEAAAEENDEYGGYRPEENPDVNGNGETDEEENYEDIDLGDLEDEEI